MFKWFKEVKNLNELKKEYWKLAKKYHPDVNPEGQETMKKINNEYDEVFKYIEQNATEQQQREYNKQGHSINDQYREVINAIIHLHDIVIEICGSWVWVTGDTKQYKEILKENGYFWAAKKKSWYWRPAEQKSYNKKPFSMDAIRQKYGSTLVQNQPLEQITAIA